MNWSYFFKAHFLPVPLPLSASFCLCFCLFLASLRLSKKIWFFFWFQVWNKLFYFIFFLLCISFHFSISSWKFFIFFSKLTSKSSLASWSSLCNSKSHFCLSFDALTLTFLMTSLWNVLENPCWFLTWRISFHNFNKARVNSRSFNESASFSARIVLISVLYVSNLRVWNNFSSESAAVFQVDCLDFRSSTEL